MLSFFISFLFPKESTEEGKIPHHLTEIVKKLLEEDNDTENQGTGPCLEYFLEERIMETLCALCVVNVKQNKTK